MRLEGVFRRGKGFLLGGRKASWLSDGLGVGLDWNHDEGGRVGGEDASGTVLDHCRIAFPHKIRHDSRKPRREAWPEC